MRVSVEFGVAFLGASSAREREIVVVITLTFVFIKLRIASPPVSFPARVVVQKAVYRFVSACE